MRLSSANLSPDSWVVPLSIPFRTNSADANCSLDRFAVVSSVVVLVRPCPAIQRKIVQQLNEPD